MYLDVTRQVGSSLGAGFFADPAFMTQLDVTFASLYFKAVDACSRVTRERRRWPGGRAGERAQPRTAPIQFALAGMNAHINHDLPLAVTSTCTTLATSPSAGAHPADYEKVDQLLDAAEQSVRQSFESAAELAVDRHLQAVDPIASWSMNSARDLAWTNSLLLWEVRADPLAHGLRLDSLAAATAAASRMLLLLSDVRPGGTRPAAPHCWYRCRPDSWLGPVAANKATIGKRSGL